MLRHARTRANKAGVPFGLTLETFPPIPKACPWLGIPLAVGSGRISPNSPSLDRIVPAMGYVPGNVIVISVRANLIKNDATPDEIVAVARGLMTALAANDNHRQTG
jgi:hypothetical protein